MTVLEKESQELKSSLTVSQSECKELKQEHQALLEWKNQKETLINETEAVQKELTDKIRDFENSINSLNETNDELKVRSNHFHIHYICFVIFSTKTKQVCYGAKYTKTILDWL